MNVETSFTSFNRLVKLAARAFYDDFTTKGDNQPKNGRGDNRGIAVVVLDALTRRQWVKEDDLARDLKLHSKQLRRTLRFFEEEKLVIRDHRKEKPKGEKSHKDVVAATADGQQIGREGNEKNKMHTYSYCCLDYAQIYDVVRYRMHRMKKNLKDELDNKNTIQEYVCPKCQRRYTALDALLLVSPEDEYFHCEKCNGELVALSDKLAAQEMGGDGDDNSRRRRREKVKNMLQNLEVQLKPLMDIVSRVKDLPVPEFGTLQAWEARNRPKDDKPEDDDLKKGPTPVQIIDPQVVFDSDEKNIKPEPIKVMPPWMIREHMILTEEQRGEVIKQESKMDDTSAAVELFDDKKSIDEKESQQSIQDEYLKAYYAAILQRQREAEEAAKKEEESASLQRQVGMKSKRDDVEGDDDVEWEEAPPAGNTTFTVNDLNVEAGSSGDDEDDIDWEEG